MMKTVLYLWIQKIHVILLIVVKTAMRDTMELENVLKMLKLVEILVFVLIIGIVEGKI
uniref:Uncharacterized protein n=1 Tax=Brassica oleracea TaxID=3712 RepID=A0A3P6F8U2_BRAOL|nr:unnamed protein product [Brassica oleracea]